MNHKYVAENRCVFKADLNEYNKIFKATFVGKATDVKEKVLYFSFQTTMMALPQLDGLVTIQ